ncbi:MAG: MMPL family transporter, partial [Solirubrobacteraceae bacterium]
AAPTAAPQLRAAWAGAREIVQDNALTRLTSHAALELARRAPRAALAFGVLLAALGFALFGSVQVQTDITKLVPQRMSSLRNLATLERASGVGGEIDLLVSGADVARPQTIAWMSKYESAVLARAGYSANHGCGHARLCPAFSLPGLFHGFGEAGGSPSTPSLDAAEVSGLLASLPAYFTQDVISANRRFASLAFGIRLMPLAEQQRLVQAMRTSLTPPRGVSARLVGLPVLAAQASAAVGSTSRRVAELLAGLAIVALVLLLAFRGDPRRALVPLLPVALASGWSALLVSVLGIQLNPMSVTLSALTIAVSTEFSVLLSERFHAERMGGRSAEEALARAWRGTGAAIAASGVTAIAGFGVLALSEIAMLRDFGLVTLIDLTVSLLGVLLLLPATITIAQDGGRFPILATARAPLASGRRAIRSLSAGVRRGRARHGTPT